MGRLVLVCRTVDDRGCRAGLARPPGREILGGARSALDAGAFDAVNRQWEDEELFALGGNAFVGDPGHHEGLAVARQCPVFGCGLGQPCRAKPLTPLIGIVDGTAFAIEVLVESIDLNEAGEELLEEVKAARELRELHEVLRADVALGEG